MSNKKRTENISASSSSHPINLSGEAYPKYKRKKYTPNLETSSNSGQKIEDIARSSAPQGASLAPGAQPGIFLKVKEKKRYHLISNFLRIAVVGFLILFLINSINVYKKSQEAKESLTYSAYEGYSKLLEGSRNTTKVQFIEAKTAFENALKSFQEAESTLWFIAEDETVYALNSSLASSAKAILESGKYFAKAGEYFAGSLEELNKIPLYFISKNEGQPETGLETGLNITEILKTGIEKASLALIETRAARDEMEKINLNLVPQEIKGKVTYAKEKINQVINTLESIENNFPAILKLLGDEKPHRYLIVLQNNAEIRPSGGFIGSYIIVDLNKGVIENLRVEDVYDLDDPYKGVIEPPDDLLSLTSNWRFRDANYSPDFFYSGAKLAWMMEKEGGPVVDTVIAVNQSLLKDFLEITGPLQVGGLQNKITFENYNTILTYIIEAKIWGKEDPKHVLKVMIPEFQKALLKKENASSIMSVLYKAAQQKMILAYSKDSVVQSLFDTFGISGRTKLLDGREDYLQVVHMCIGGNKTEHFIEENITHKTNIQNDGSLTDELTITRTHTFDRDNQAKWNEIWDSFGFDYSEVPGYVVDILGRGTNVVISRVYVPEGSQLIEVTGVDKNSVEVKYDSDLKKTYFLTRFSTPPQNATTLTLKYRLPFKLDFDPLDTYKFTAQKQQGSIGSVLTKTISAEVAEMIPYAYYPEDAYLKEDNKVVYATNLVYDRYFSAVFGK